MKSFEEIGRKVDRRLERLGEIAEKNMGPANRGKVARSLRSISDALTRLASDLESYGEAKEKQEKQEK